MDNADIIQSGYDKYNTVHDELSRPSSARTSCMGGWEGGSNGQICGKSQREKKDVCLVSPQVKTRDDNDNASVFTD